jgi:hypothetical protein
MSAFSDWLGRFRELHERARKGEFGPGEESAYDSMCDELGRTLLAAQKLSLKPGQQARRTLRVARALQIDIEIGGEEHRTVTLDLSTVGFSAVLPKPPAPGVEVGISLRLPATEPLQCRARITDVKPLPGSARVAAQYLDLPPAALKRLEFFVVDAVLAQLRAG